MGPVSAGAGRFIVTAKSTCCKISKRRQEERGSFHWCIGEQVVNGLEYTERNNKNKRKKQDFNDEKWFETIKCNNKFFVKEQNLLHQILRLKHVKMQNYFCYKSATSGGPLGRSDATCTLLGV